MHATIVPYYIASAAKLEAGLSVPQILITFSVCTTDDHDVITAHSLEFPKNDKNKTAIIITVNSQVFRSTLQSGPGLPT